MFTNARLEILKGFPLALKTLCLLLTLGASVVGSDMPAPSLPPPISPSLTPPPLDAVKLETDILNGIRALKKNDDLSLLHDKVKQLQQIEAKNTGGEEWRRLVTIQIKRDIEKAATLSDTDQRRLFDAVADWNRARDYVRDGQLELGLKAAKQATVTCGALVGEDSYLQTALLELQAEALIGAGRGGEAELAVEQLKTARAKQYGPQHPLGAAATDLAGQVALAKGQWTKAAEEFNSSLTSRTKVLGATHPSVVTARLGLIRVAVGQQQSEDAGKALVAFENDWKQLMQTNISVRVEYLSVAVQVHRGANQLFQAQGDQENLVAALMNALPRTHPRLSQEVLLLRTMLAEQGKWPLVRRLEAFWGLPPLAVKEP